MKTDYRTLILIVLLLFIQSHYPVYSITEDVEIETETKVPSEKSEQPVEVTTTDRDSEENKETLNNNSNTATSADDSPEPQPQGEGANKDLEIFRKLFLQKRAQHLEAVESLLETYNYEKTYQMIDLLLTRMRTVVGTSRQTLIEKGFEPGMPFPSDEDTKDAIAVIMENAGLFGDMALRIPDITHSSLAKKKPKVSEVLKWSISYSQETGFLDDLSTRMFDLASQELNIIPKEPSFHNPYRREYKFQPPASPPSEKKKKAKPEKKRGPRATKVEL